MSEDSRQPKPARWHCKIDGQEVGPLTDKQLRNLRESGKLARTDSIKKGANGKWVLAERIKGLFPAESIVDEHKRTDQAAIAVKDESTTESLPTAEPDIDLTSSDDASPDPSNFDAGDVPILSPDPYLPLTKTVNDAEMRGDTAPKSTPDKSMLKWIAIGGGVGGLVLVVIVSMLAMWMMGDDESEIAALSPPGTSGDITGTTTNEQRVSTEILPQNSEALSAMSLKSHDTGTDASTAHPTSIANNASTAIGSESVAITENIAPPTSSNGVIAAATKAAPAEPPSQITNTQVENDAMPSEDAKDTAADIELAPNPKPTIGFGTVAATPPDVDTAVVDATERETQETAEAKKAVALINAMVRQRLDQIAERAGLGQEMEKNRQRFAAAMTAIRTATVELPKMQRQYGALQDSRRELIAMRQTSKTPLIIDRTGRQLDAQMAKLQQAMTQVSSTGNAAVRAKPGIEEQWAEQNKRLAALQAREGDVHSKLMQTIDPFGQQSKRYREILLNESSNWDSACVEGCLIRGLAELYEGRLQPAYDDFANVIQRLEGVLRNKRGPKDSPERRILQVAFAASGLTQFRMKKEPEAMKDLGKAIAVSDHYTFPSVIRGLVEVERNRHDAAMRDFEAARRLDNPHASREAARLLLTSASLANPKRALTFAEEACERETSWSNHAVHAAALAATGQTQLAKETYQKAVEIAPTDQLDRLAEEVAKLPAQ